MPELTNSVLGMRDKFPTITWYLPKFRYNKILTYFDKFILIYLTTLKQPILAFDCQSQV